MGRSADTNRGEVQRARLGFSDGDQIANGLEALGRRNHQDARRYAKRDDRRKISRWMVAKVRIKRRRNRVCGPMGQNCVAIWVRLGDEGCTDRTPAPVRFSTTMVCPSWDESCSNTTRGIMSVVLPAATGTIALIGFVGQVCALASIVAAVRPRAASTVRQIGFMMSSFREQIYRATTDLSGHPYHLE